MFTGGDERGRSAVLPFARGLDLIAQTPLIALKEGPVSCYTLDQRHLLAGWHGDLTDMKSSHGANYIKRLKRFQSTMLARFGKHLRSMIDFRQTRNKSLIGHCPWWYRRSVQSHSPQPPR